MEQICEAWSQQVHYHEVVGLFLTITLDFGEAFYVFIVFDMM